MSGIASFMISPSARTTKRSTPCVDGCCGPMLSVMSSVTSPPLTCRSMSTSKPPRLIRPSSGLQQALSRRRDAVVLLRLDEVLAQRVPRPVLRHEQAAQVGVSREVHAEEVVDLALLPLRVRPHAGQALHDGVLACGIDLQDEAVPVRIRVQMIDDLNDIPLRIV